MGVCCLLRGFDFWCESHVESCVLLSVSNVGIREFFTGKCHVLWCYDGERIQFGNSNCTLCYWGFSLKWHRSGIGQD